MIKKELEKYLLSVQKPGRYVGGEPGSIVKDAQNVNIRFAFCFPDTYEIGMSHLGMKILYSLYNSIDDVWCERVFAPWTDMEQVLRENNFDLYGLESGDSLREFDFVGFTLQYELSYTNMLNMLDLARIPVKASDRGEDYPIVICGGPCACNPEPLCDFVDIFSLGEGEEVSIELFDLYRDCKNKGVKKSEFLRMAAKIEGIYVPSLYTVDYNEDGTVKGVTAHGGAPATVKKRIVQNMDDSFYPKEFVVPMIDIVHDRAVGEVFRGCIRGCRFCQAGFIYRPVREKSVDTVNKQCYDLCSSTGYDEISLSSLSTTDYTEIQPLLNKLLSWTVDDKVNVSLPSMRVDSFSPELMKKIKSVRKSGLTFAPEAGSQRLRDAINKNISEEELMKTCNIAFSGGWTTVKLYFMIGLPTETMDDVAAIADLGQRVVNAYYSNPDKPKGKSVNVTVSASSFVPKPFTPFQWEPQDTIDMLHEKQKHLCDSITTRKITPNWHDADTSFLEAVIARGDRRVGQAIYKAWQLGCKFDSWGDFFDLDVWRKAFSECSLDPAFYANRRRDLDEVLPWDHIDFGVSKKFLISELEKAYQSVTTPNCRQKCASCGANKLTGGVCSVYSKSTV